MALRRLMAVGLLALATASTGVRAYEDMYPPAEIANDAGRLATAVGKIYRLALEPALTAKERRQLGRIEFDFPKPNADSQLLNFYAYRRDGIGRVVMPVLSLKQLEDLTTAYAWLHAKDYSLSTIDTYYAMLRRKLVVDWRNERFPAILPALGVPKLAYKERGIDTTSLALRNEAFAFIMAHELGHLLFRHKPYGQITTEQARADELQSDQFALDLMVRTNTPPMGAVLFFQAQAYSMSHRGEFASPAQWQKYLRTEATHPLSTARIANMAQTFTQTMPKIRPNEAPTWRFIGTKVRDMVPILEDVELQRCIAKTAQRLTIDDLKPRRNHTGLEACR